MFSCVNQSRYNTWWLPPFVLVIPKAHVTPRASKEVAFSYDHFAGF
jgi:hypothetical protein